MEKFHFDLKDKKPFTLVFPHIPKTGGTTLLYHFRKNFGDNNILSYGPHNRCVRFFGDEPQLEEFDTATASRLRVVQGHGVGESLFPLLPDENIRLLVVLRNPVGLSRSRFNHKKNSLGMRGVDVTSEKFLTSNPGDFMSRLLLKKFQGFFDRSAKTRRDRVISVLRKFDYVFTTEQLDAQVKGLMAELSLPDELERRRVAEKKAVLKATDEELTQANPLDMEIFETANQVLGTGAHHNPFGFDPEGRSKVIETIYKRGPSPDEIVNNMYHELAISLCKDLRAEAALAKLATGKAVAIEQPEIFKEILEREWAQMVPKLTPERAKISNERKAHWQAHN